MGFLPLDIGKIIYGGMNPGGTTRDPFISLGRSISHGIRPGAGQNVSPVYGNTQSGYPPLDDSGLPPAAQVDEPIVQTNRDFPSLNPTEQAAAHYASIARQPSAPDDLAPRTPNGGMLPGGMPQTRTYAGPGYTDPREANSVIPGLINWNGPGQANPTGGEPVDDRGARNFMALARRLGGMGITGGSTPAGPAPNWASAYLPKIRGKG